jgi:hypothetical protein
MKTKKLHEEIALKKIPCTIRNPMHYGFFLFSSFFASKKLPPYCQKPHTPSETSCTGGFLNSHHFLTAKKGGWHGQYRMVDL